MNIEDVAEKTPEKVFKVHIDLKNGLNIDDLLKAATDLGIEQYKSQLVFLIKNIYDCFIDHDCDLIEVNPLVLTKDGRVLAADSKVVVDDNAGFRQ